MTVRAIGRLALSPRCSPFTESLVHFLVRETTQLQYLCTVRVQVVETELLLTVTLIVWYIYVLIYQTCSNELIYQRDRLLYHRQISQFTCRDMLKPSTRRKLGKVKRLGDSCVVGRCFPKGPAHLVPAMPGQKGVFVLDARGAER